MSHFTPILSRLSNWSAELRFEGIPEPVLSVARRSLIDTLGVALAGTRSAVAQRVRSVALAGAAHGDATVLGAPRPLAAPAAAFLNTVAGHALDFDDNCYAGFVHGSVVIVPAALAAVQAGGGDGRALLVALVAGAECEYVLAKALGRSLYDVGWWTTSVLGVVGACAATCRALRLDAEITSQALGLALSGTGGMKVGFGNDAKPLLAGRAAEGGVLAALFAHAGCRGPVDAVENSKGLATLMNGGALDTVPLSRLGCDWSLATPGLDIKRIPVCLSSHAAVDALRELRAEHRFEAADVEQVVCDVPTIVVANLVHDRPTDKQQAQFSMPFAIAATLLRGDLTLADLSDSFVLDSVTVAMMTRVRMHTGQRWDDPLLRDLAPEGACVTVQLRDGRRFESFRAKAVGSASEPLSEATLTKKFLACAVPVLGAQRSESLLERLSSVDACASVRELDALLQA